MMFSVYRRKIKQRGTTLVEMMVSVGIGGLVTLAASSILVFSVNQFNIVMQRNTAEQKLLWAEYYIRLYLSNAVGVLIADTRGDPTKNCWDVGQTLPTPNAPFTYPGGGLNNLIAQGNGGIFASCYLGGTSDSSSSQNQLDPLAVFVREKGPAAVGGGYTSIFNVSELSYQRPIFQPGGVNQSGRLIFTTGPVVTNPGTPLPPGTSITPSPSDVSVDQIVFVGLEFDNLQNPAVAAPLMVAKSAAITVVVRYFTDPDSKNWQWCMPVYNATTNANTPGSVLPPGTCNNLTGHVDLSSTIEVGFRDNVLSPQMVNGNANPQRLFGSLYFYQQNLPASTGF